MLEVKDRVIFEDMSGGDPTNPFIHVLLNYTYQTETEVVITIPLANSIGYIELDWQKHVVFRCESAGFNKVHLEQRHMEAIVKKLKEVKKVKHILERGPDATESANTDS